MSILEFVHMLNVDQGSFFSSTHGTSFGIWQVPCMGFTGWAFHGVVHDPWSGGHPFWVGLKGWHGWLKGTEGGTPSVGPLF